jgi:hypothetical protein
MKVSEMSNNVNKDFQWKEECKCLKEKELTGLKLVDPLVNLTLNANSKRLVKSYKIQYNTNEGR